MKTADSTTQNISCAVMAGGRSSRFGSDKARAPWGEHGSVIETVIATAGALFDDIFIISGAKKKYQHYGVPVYPDIRPGAGPLSGIHTALSVAVHSRVMILACDMPAISPPFLQYICKLHPWAPVILPESTSGPEPLHAIWHRSLCPLAEQTMRRGRTGLRNFLADLPCRIITVAEARSHGLDLNSLKSTNTPEALEGLRREMLKTGQSFARQKQ